MSQDLNAKDLEARVRQRVHDNKSNVYTADELLACADDELRRFFSVMRTTGDSWMLDYEDVAVGALLNPETAVYEYELPRHMQDVQLVEAVFPGGANAEPIPKVSLEHKDLARGSSLVRSNGAVWLFARLGRLQIRGQWMSTQPSIRIWFQRARGPMTYGTATGGSTTTLAIGTVSGAHKSRTDIYRDMYMEVTADSGVAANVGQIVRVQSFDAGTGTMTFTTALPGAVNSGTEWAMVVPVPPEHCELVIERVAVHLLSRSGNLEEYQAHLGRLQVLENEFERAIGQRQTGEPRRIYNSRRIR